MAHGPVLGAATIPITVMALTGIVAVFMPLMVPAVFASFLMEVVIGKQALREVWFIPWLAGVATWIWTVRWAVRAHCAEQERRRSKSVAQPRRTRP